MKPVPIFSESAVGRTFSIYQSLFMTAKQARLKAFFWGVSRFLGSAAGESKGLSLSPVRVHLLNHFQNFLPWTASLAARCVARASLPVPGRFPL